MQIRLKITQKWNSGSNLLLKCNPTSTEDVQKALNQGRFYNWRNFFRKRMRNNTDIDKED